MTSRHEARAYFDRMLVEGDPQSCWLWLYGQNGTGYGLMRVEGRKSRTVHRLAFFSARGHWPQVARHSCDVKLCFNPSHVEDGTSADNSRDMVERGRSARGARNGQTKLSDEDMTEIRRLLAEGTMFQKDIAARFGISKAHVTNIKLGKRWAHLDDGR